VAALQWHGYAATYIYGRTNPVLSRLLMALGRLTMLRHHDLWQDYTEYTASKKARMRSPLLAAVYASAILLDYYVQVWLKLLPHLFSQRIVVADRYVYDTVICDLAVHLAVAPATVARLIKLGLQVLPRPTLTVLIDAPEAVAFARKDDVPHIDFLRERRGWYLQLPDYTDVTLFNGEASPNTLVYTLLGQIATQLHFATGEAA
jgi:dTMP kinase